VTDRDRIAALEREQAELTVMVAEQAVALSRLGEAFGQLMCVVRMLQELALADSLPGERPLPPEHPGSGAH
jgi:hypothetical protein